MDKDPSGACMLERGMQRYAQKPDKVEHYEKEESGVA